MAIRFASASRIGNKLPRTSNFWDGSAVVVNSSYESIATVTVGSGGSSTITFSSIPSTYKHLQIRAISRDSRALTLNSLAMRINGDSGANYSYHTILADGSSITADGGGNSSNTDYMISTGSSALANTFAVSVWDILDYSSSTKNKTIRMLGGTDLNGSGRLNFTSAGWFNTNAITSLTFFGSGSASFVQYTHFALYGIKG